MVQENFDALAADLEKEELEASSLEYVSLIKSIFKRNFYIIPMLVIVGELL